MSPSTWPICYSCSNASRTPKAINTTPVTPCRRVRIRVPKRLLPELSQHRMHCVRQCGSVRCSWLSCRVQWSGSLPDTVPLVVEYLDFVTFVFGEMIEF